MICVAIYTVHHGVHVRKTYLYVCVIGIQYTKLNMIIEMKSTSIIKFKSLEFRFVSQNHFPSIDTRQVPPLYLSNVLFTKKIDTPRYIVTVFNYHAQFARPGIKPIRCARSSTNICVAELPDSKRTWVCWVSQRFRHTLHGWSEGECRTNTDLREVHV